MKKNAIRMSDVVDRDIPDFSIEYELSDSVQLKQFPGCILNFSYYSSPTLQKVFCDIFPEFKVDSNSNEIISPNDFIPRKSTADMWIVSDKNRVYHEKSIYNGRICYLMQGSEIIATCKITNAMNHLKKEYNYNKVGS